ncbi:PREDICTED: adenosine receptor A1-like [Acropora digitifera]|uniref:adenosine receptor A1-like n=1 Tax=Acropora digitifera TaxID=70779 RepID=UPI00077AC2BC|nr:PREDICTED: adenosine receptor A1-like [Acropora digitifera]
MSLFSNESISSFCGPSSTLYYNATQNFSKAFYIFACGINMIISVSSTLGNILVLCAIQKCQSLHSPSKALLSSLAMTDLFVGIVVLPLFIAYHLTIILEMLNYYCVIAVSYATTSRFISSVSLLTVVTISVERYMAFRLRLRYRAVVTFKRVVSILVSEWIIAALWSGSRFWSETASAISGVVSLISCCLVAPACYFAIRRGIRGQIRQQYRAVVTFQRVVSILVSEWIIAALWSGLWFWSVAASVISGTVSLISCCLVALVCYFSIRRGIRGQIRQQQNHGRIAIASNFDLPHYRKTLRNMMWISGLLIACYIPFLLALLAVLIFGLKNSTRFAVGFSAIAVYLNSSLNPVLYCWRIKDLRDGVLENCNRVCNCLFHLIRSPTQNEITGNTTASIPRPFQRQGPGNEDV